MNTWLPIALSRVDQLIAILNDGASKVLSLVADLEMLSPDMLTGGSSPRLRVQIGHILFLAARLLDAAGEAVERPDLGEPDKAEIRTHAAALQRAIWQLLAASQQAIPDSTLA